jgi:hypothetical protein
MHNHEEFEQPHHVLSSNQVTSNDRLKSSIKNRDARTATPGKKASGKIERCSRDVFAQECKHSLSPIGAVNFVRELHLRAVNFVR